MTIGDCVKPIVSPGFQPLKKKPKRKKGPHCECFPELPKLKSKPKKYCVKKWKKRKERVEERKESVPEPQIVAQSPQGCECVVVQPETAGNETEGVDPLKTVCDCVLPGDFDDPKSKSWHKSNKRTIKRAKTARLKRARFLYWLECWKYKILHLFWFIVITIRTKVRATVIAAIDLYRDLTGQYILLRPSEILFPRDFISPICYEIRTRDPVEYLLEHALMRTISPAQIARYVTVVQREDRLGPLKNEFVLNNPHILPGWFAIEGLGCLWVLKALEDFKRVKFVKVKYLRKISEEYWNAVCSERVIEGGRKVDFLGEDGSPGYWKEKRRAYRYWVRSLKAKDLGFHRMSRHRNQGLRLGHYETSDEPRYTKDCAGYGLCHSPVEHFEPNTNPDGDYNHRCWRPYTTITRRGPAPYFSLIHESIYVYRWVTLYLIGLFAAIMSGCFFRRCWGVIGKLNFTSFE